jgi:hypothetical protein
VKEKEEDGWMDEWIVEGKKKRGSEIGWLHARVYDCTSVCVHGACIPVRSLHGR